MLCHGTDEAGQRNLAFLHTHLPPRVQWGLGVVAVVRACAPELEQAGGIRVEGPLRALQISFLAATVQKEPGLDCS